jgi:DNA repair exonuclease SbcCD nuclease subunit
MLRIAHIADVHWRGLSRHNEYREVFQAFVSRTRELHVEHVFVGGDIFHTKTTGLSPEYIQQMSWWLQEMASVAQVHLILGNHDGNLTNLSRQDAVSPIVAALGHPNVHLYKKSGVYEFAPGYTWCVFSLFDEEGWKNVEPSPGKVNIACYHGPVFGALTDWLIEEGLTVDSFKKFDFCFLGDIHKMQYLSGRESTISIDESDLARYPGAEIVSREEG